MHRAHEHMSMSGIQTPDSQEVSAWGLLQAKCPGLMLMS